MTVGVSIGYQVATGPRGRVVPGGPNGRAELSACRNASIVRCPRSNSSRSAGGTSCRCRRPEGDRGGVHPDVSLLDLQLTYG